jgi:predicted secreted protein
MTDRVLANTHHSYRVEVPGTPTDGGGYFQGLFMLGSKGFSGDYNNAVTETYTLESAGEVTFTTGTF